MLLTNVLKSKLEELLSAFSDALRRYRLHPVDSGKLYISYLYYPLWIM